MIKGIKILVLLLLSTFAYAGGSSIGEIKKLSGVVVIQRDGVDVTPTLGGQVFQQDVIVTGKDGKVGLLFLDDSRLAVGPNSNMAMGMFQFNPVNDEGSFDVSINKGTLSVISGKMTARKPGSLKVKTPAAILAVRGTEFSVKIQDKK
jgi:hypothetical protein